MATSYITILGPQSSGILAANAVSGDTSMFQISGLLGLSDDVTQQADENANAETGNAGASKGCVSWQIDTPCITPFYDGNAWDLRKSEEYNIPLFSHGKFSVGIKPSGVGYALKGDMYACIPNIGGTIDTYHTSGMFPDGIPSTRLSWRYTTPTGGMADGFGTQETLANGNTRYMYWGNLALIGGGDAAWGGNTSYGVDDGEFQGTPNFVGPPGRGGGYLGPVGLPPVEASILIPSKTGFSGPNCNLWKNGVEMTHEEVTGAQVLSLDPNTVNVPVDPLAFDQNPVDHPAHVFSTGGRNGPGGGWVQFSGDIGRRNANDKNTAVTCNQAWFSFIRLGGTEAGGGDNVKSGDWPDATNPVRLMWGYSRTATNYIDKMPYDYHPSLSQVGVMNATTPFINPPDSEGDPDGWGSTNRLDFGESGHSGDIVLGYRAYGVGSPNRWVPHTDQSHLCGDPHITPMIGKKYDL